MDCTRAEVSYRQALQQDVGDVDKDGNVTEDIPWTREHESAECLYLILASTDIFGETALDKIHSRSIANLDGDAVPEIIDPWGRPYTFIRHPVGLDSPTIKNFDPDAAPANQYPLDPDPFDFLVADWRMDASVLSGASAPVQRFYTIYLPPAVISSGPDKEFDIRRTFYQDDTDATTGVRDDYSASAVVWNESRLAPLYPNPTSWGPGLNAYRYPDPFFNVSAIAFTSTGPYEITDSDLGQIDLAKMGGGLGGVDNSDGYDAAADNISSLDAGF